MTEYLKRLYRRQPSEKEYYHWQTKCPDHPHRGHETIMVFKEKPSRIIACPRCTQLDRS
jgi:hypothetical protein